MRNPRPNLDWILPLPFKGQYDEINKALDIFARCVGPNGYVHSLRRVIQFGQPVLRLRFGAVDKAGLKKCIHEDSRFRELAPQSNYDV